MDQCLAALKKHFQEEPYARIFGIEIVELEEGRALLKMQTSSRMNNLFGTIHGAATYSLLDAAFELAVNSHGTVAVALPGETLQAEARETNLSRKISACEIRITGQDARLVATAQALAYRKKDSLPFL